MTLVYDKLEAAWMEYDELIPEEGSVQRLEYLKATYPNEQFILVKVIK